MMEYEYTSESLRQPECIKEVKRLLDMASTSVKSGSLIKMISIPLQSQAKHIAVYHCTCGKCPDYYNTVSKYL